MANQGNIRDRLSTICSGNIPTGSGLARENHVYSSIFIRTFGSVPEMDSGDFQRLMRVAVQERAREVAAADKKYRDRVDAIQKVWELAKIEVPGEQDVEEEARRHGELMARVQEAMKALDGDFTLHHVLATIRERHPRQSDWIKPASVSAALKRLTGIELDLVEAGSGKRASVYRRRVEEIGPHLTLVG